MKDKVGLKKSDTNLREYHLCSKRKGSLSLRLNQRALFLKYYINNLKLTC